MRFYQRFVVQDAPATGKLLQVSGSFLYVERVTVNPATPVTLTLRIDSLDNPPIELCEGLTLLSEVPFERLYVSGIGFGASSVTLIVSNQADIGIMRTYSKLVEVTSSPIHAADPETALFDQLQAAGKNPYRTIIEDHITIAPGSNVFSDPGSPFYRPASSGHVVYPTRFFITPDAVTPSDFTGLANVQVRMIEFNDGTDKDILLQERWSYSSGNLISIHRVGNPFFNRMEYRGTFTWDTFEIRVGGSMTSLGHVTFAASLIEANV